MSAECFGRLYEAERLVLCHYRDSIDRFATLPVVSEVVSDITEFVDANNPAATPSAEVRPFSVGVAQEELSVPPSPEPPERLLTLKVEVVQPNELRIAAAGGSDDADSDGRVHAPPIDALRPAVSPGRGVPFVSYVPDDLVALCSSGGGIRSAIFNLGVIQGLGKLGLLPLFDYHSTVSGGGYTGGWWTTWRANHPDDKGLAPTADENLVEPIEIRRLRERSRFLSPTGFALGAEFWRGTAMWSTGLVGTLLLAVSVITAILLLWASLRALVGITDSDYEPSHVLILLAVAVVLVIASEVPSDSWRARLRTIGVVLFLAAGVALGLDGLWTLAGAVKSQAIYASASSIAVSGSASLAIRWMASWMAKREETSPRNNLAVLLSRSVPQILAVAVIASIAFLLMLAASIFEWREELTVRGVPAPYALALLALVASLAFAVLGHIVVSTPSTLHCFYRGRIEEAFLQVPTSASTISSVQSWPSQVSRPLHIVNCCASDTCYTTTDQMDRRGTSVSLSSVGAYPSGVGVMPTMTSPSLSESITSSAAAVDPSMGFYSAKLGRLVAFVLFAFNLRLGTWWRPNQATENGKSKGWDYFRNRASLRAWKEMLSQISLPTPTASPSDQAYAGKQLDVRLTDGGHFENLAAYEMVRRRCRYIVICDGGADPGNHFTELSSLQRLVRRDFGVEIEIDLDPLRINAAGQSARHLVVGRIRYPRLSGNKDGFSEDGILLYVKPALTGDEPEDVTQYQSSSPAFPHETTTDQFFDDNQWEAYRRLGEHSITEELKFVERYLGRKTLAKPEDAARIFDATVRELGSTDRRVHTAASTSGSDRIGPWITKTADLMDDLFPELTCVAEADREAAKLSLQAAVAALDMHERAFYCCDLNRLGDHLENWGRENRTDRLVASADIRRWWPVIASLYSIRFRDQYLGEKYGLNLLLPICNRERVVFSASRLEELSTRSPRPNSTERLLRVWGTTSITDDDYVLHAAWPSDGTGFDLGSLAFSFDPECGSVVLKIDGLQVAPGFWSVGINVVLIDELLERLGFDMSGLPEEERPHLTRGELPIGTNSVSRVIVVPADADADAVQRPDQRCGWIGRGFIQTRGGFLVRDQKSRARAGLYYTS